MFNNIQDNNDKSSFNDFLKLHTDYSYNNVNKFKSDLEKELNELSEKMSKLMKNNPIIYEFKTLYEKYVEINDKLRYYDTTKIF